MVEVWRHLAPHGLCDVKAVHEEKWHFYALTYLEIENVNFNTNKNKKCELLRKKKITKNKNKKIWVNKFVRIIIKNNHEIKIIIY